MFKHFSFLAVLVSCNASNAAFNTSIPQVASKQPFSSSNPSAVQAKVPEHMSTIEAAAEEMDLKIIPSGAVLSVEDYRSGVVVRTIKETYTLPDGTKREDFLVSFAIWKPSEAEGGPSQKNISVGPGSLVRMGNTNILVVASHIDQGQNIEDNNSWIAVKLLPVTE